MSKTNKSRRASQPASDEKTSVNSSLDTLQKAVGTVSGVVAISYVLGFIIVNRHLLQFGVYDANLLSTRYLSAGLLYFFFFTVTALFNIRYFRDGRLGTVITFVLSTLFCFGAIAALNYVPNLSWGSLGEFAFWMGVLTVGIDDTVTSYFIRQQSSRFPAYLKDRIFSPVRVLPILVAVLIYSSGVYPNISPAVGGGAPVEIALIVKEENTKLLEQLVQMDNPNRTVTLLLIHQTDKAYVVLAPDPRGGDERAVLIRNELVEGAIFANRASPLPTRASPPVSTPSPTAVGP